jgi:hypothetical protein
LASARGTLLSHALAGLDGTRDRLVAQVANDEVPSDGAQKVLAEGVAPAHDAG